MLRRDFVTHLSMMAAAAVLIGCRKYLLPGNLRYEGKVAVIGAGAAGLYAAYLLKSRGVDVEVFEASDRYGGRLAKRDDFANFPIDLGAQWLHGKNNILGDLIAKTNTAITRDEIDPDFWFNGAFVSELPVQPLPLFYGRNLPDISYLEHATAQGLGEEYRYIVEAIAGDYGAAANTLSVFHAQREEEDWSSGDDDFKFAATYYDLIDRHIAADVADRVRLNTPIATVDYREQSIRLSSAEGEIFTADKVIITVPITVLRDGDIDFQPALPAEKTAAFGKIGMGPGMKVFLRFSNRFFRKSTVGGSVCAAYVDDSVGKTVDDAVIMAFVMGDQAAALHALGSDTAIVEALLGELDSMYGNQASAAFVDAHVQNWTAHPHIRGAYSYATVGIDDARSVAARPIGNRLYFAGEAMNLNGHHQTVHGAVETGYNAVLQLLNEAV